MSEYRFRMLDQAWERSQAQKEGKEKPMFEPNEDELPADYPPMADDPQSMTSGETDE